MARTPDQLRLLRIWSQDQIPAVRRVGPGHDLRIKLPFRDDNRTWLSQLGRRRPRWNSDLKCWEIPQSWLKGAIDICLQRYGRVYVIQPHRSHEVCARACWEATGYECQCSCLGANHGSQDSGRSWREVSETFATRWGDEDIACRLISG